jgi:hypothetical protein
MLIITNDEKITLTWVQGYFSLVDFTHYNRQELVTVRHTDGRHLLCVSFGALQQLREHAATARRINADYEQRRNLIAQQLAAGGNPS